MPVRPPDLPYLNGVMCRLISLRWLAIGAQLLALLMARFVWSLELPWWPMLVGIALLCVVNVGVNFRLRSGDTVDEWELFSHLCLDVGVLAWLLYFSGGSVNPFIALMLVPLTISAVTLPWRQGWILSGFTLLLYAGLVFFNVPLPPPEGHLAALDRLLAETCGLGAGPEGHHSEGFALHVVGMWLNFVISALIIAFFLHRQTRSLREREHELQLMREQVLRQEKVLALGLQAAGAAHRLGTPLASMAVLVDEIADGLDGEELDHSVLILKSQLARCKGILAEMVAAGHGHPAQAADAWVAGLVDEWQMLRPEVGLTPSVWSTGPAPLIRPDRSLDQALQSLLDNAANVSPAGVDLRMGWDRDALEIHILDRGPGIDAGLAAQLGKDFVPSVGGQGLGIGFFLTNATIEHFGGAVRIDPRESGGSVIIVRLPLAGLRHE